MTALDKKLARDLARMWGQALTIALVVACGIASFVAMQSAYESLLLARDRYYEAARFPDVFVHLERAPEAAARRVEELPGVSRVETRIVQPVMLPLADLSRPAIGEVVSVPGGEPALSVPRVRKGRMVERGRSDEVVLLESFARAHGLEPGGKVPVVLNGTWRELSVVGIAVSPEYLFAVSAGSFVQDDKRFAVLWMDRDAVAAAFRMEGTFNDVVVRAGKSAGAEEPGGALADEVRRALEPYGVRSAVARGNQASNKVLDGELTQLREFALVTPVIFLLTAASLVNLVLARVLGLQRGQIATLKAVGYRRREIAVHYLKLVAAIVGLGAALGAWLGDLLGAGMVELYRPYFQFGDLTHHLSAKTVALGVVVSAGAGLAGAMTSVLRAAALPAAEAMQPEAPATFHPSLLERLGALRLLGAAGRMVGRELLRRPVRAFLSCAGVAFATAIVCSARFTYDAMDLLVELQFEGAQREDLEVSFQRPLPREVVREIGQLPGVLEVQPQRVVPVRARQAQRARDTAIVGLSTPAAPLRSVAQWPRRPLDLPADGIVISEALASALGVKVGDCLRMEVLEGDRREIAPRVAGLVPDVFGLFAYARYESVQALLREEGNVTSVLVRHQPEAELRLLARLKELPSVASVTQRRDLLERFRAQAQHVWITTGILTAFGATIAFGVIYNQARIALSVRARDLASLRVLGFTRREISAMLLGEIAFYVLCGLPLGMALGKALVLVITNAVDPETYRLPATMSPQTYAFAALVTLAAAAVSALVVRRRLDRLDLVGVLKTRE